ncbi:MAG: LPS-assembly protein LptD [Candidatus Aminicenantales bacterium]
MIKAKSYSFFLGLFLILSHSGRAQSLWLIAGDRLFGLFFLSPYFADSCQEGFPALKPASFSLSHLSLVKNYSPANFFPMVSSAQEAENRVQEISGEEAWPQILARRYEREKERIFASGEVEVRFKKLRLFADRVEINTTTRDVLAEGNVVLQLPEETISASRLFLNLDTLRGKLEEVAGMIQPTIFYQAAAVERRSEAVYEFSRPSLTTCAQPTPRWRFYCQQASFKKDDYIEMRNAVFAVKNVPIFYLPYFRYPLNRERSTGFLMPQVGYNGVKGFTFTESFYWAIRRNMDATLTFDYYSARGVGAGIEYRYLFGPGKGGEARVYTFSFKRDPKTGEKPERAYLIRLNHNQPLPFGFSLIANIDHQTSFDFLREFDNNYRRALVTNRSSQAFLSRSWSHYNLSFRLARFDTYFAQINNSVVTTNLPQVSFTSFRTRLDPSLPVFFSYSASFQSWQYGWKTDYDAGKQRRTEIITFSPVLSFPFTAIPWLVVNTNLATNMTYYTKSYAPNTRKIIAEPLLIKNLSLGIEITGPILFRIFEAGKLVGGARVKHLIEPFASFRYETPTTQGERVITASGYFVRTFQLSYGLTNRVVVKEEANPREIFTWGIGQTYYFRPEESPLSPFRTPEGQVPRFSDVGSYIRFYPLRRVSLDFSVSYNTYWRQLASVRLQTNLNSPAAPFFLSINWFKSLNPWYRDVLWDRHQVGTTVKVNLPDFPFEALGDLSFNIVERRLLYAGVSAIYHYQCLDFKLDFRLFQFREKPELQFKFSIGLGHIGKTTDFLAGLEW